MNSSQLPIPQARTSSSTWSACGGPGSGSSSGCIADPNRSTPAARIWSALLFSPCPEGNKPYLEGAPVAQIDVLTDRPIGTVDRRIFGSFAENLGRCIYGGLFDEGPPGGFRTDVLGAVRDLGRDERALAAAGGSGDESDRHPPIYTFRHGRVHPWCAAAGVEPVLCLDMGTGTLDEALAWVEYCNGTATLLGPPPERQRPRRAYGVRYWGLGREMYRPADRGGVRRPGPAVGQGAQAARSRHAADQLRPDRHGRLGPRRHRRSRALRRPARHPPLYRLGRLLVQRARAALRRTGPVGCRRPDRPGPLRAADRAEICVACDEWKLVPVRRRAAKS